MKLQDCINDIVLKTVVGDTNIDITGIEINSQKVKPGNLFIALRGYVADGHQFISQAIENGACAILVEEKSDVQVPLIIVPDTRKAMAIVANTFYNHPTRELALIGVTGTNGKTTTSYMIETILKYRERKTGLIGTMQMKIGSKEYPVTNTTPNSLELQKSFRTMKEAGCDYGVIEVSSHALHMGRTWGSIFRTAVFTNLTQDHLDYHKTMENYRAAKGLLFSQLSLNAYAVLNKDDEASAYYAEVTSAQVITYGVEKKADVWAEGIRTSAKGTAFTLHTFAGSIDIHLKMIGIFNIYNALAAVTTTLLEKVPLDEIKKALESMSGVRGRFETVDEGQAFTVIVDYAHTPDSLKNVLTTIRDFAEGRVICVIGCGGNRDRTKRAAMGNIAVKYSDVSIFTSDNPRTEDPNMILLEMAEGVKESYAQPHCIEDRKQAICYALNEAREEDVVLIAGKGHETYQEINGVRYDFDDREIARSVIQDMNGDKNATNV